MTQKPWPTKGFVRAGFLIVESAYEPGVHWLTLEGRLYVSAFVYGGHRGRVIFSAWLRRWTTHEERGRLVRLLASGYLGTVEVNLSPRAFPWVYSQGEESAQKT